MFWFYPFELFQKSQSCQGGLRGISGGAQGDLRGISGGAHPLETIFDFFNIKKSCVRVLKSIHVDKILLEGL